MLNKLTIKNIALIDNAEIEFTNGLNVLSGETGAGKSVIIESINFILGAKADKNLIRSGADECFVKAEFDVSNNEAIKANFSEFDMDEEDSLIITRKFTLDGKSAVKINGNTVTIGMLRGFTSKLVDVHGQSEHFHLLKNSNQLDLIDKFGGAEIKELKERLSSLFKEYKEVAKEYESLGGSENERLVKLDILNYQINEIERLNLKENEEEELLSIRNKLRYQEKILNALNSTRNAITTEGGLSDVLSNLSRLVSGISELGCEYQEVYEQVIQIYSEVDELSAKAESILDGMDEFGYSADEIEERLSAIKTIKKKYGDSYNEIQRFLNEAILEKERLENFNQTAKDFENQIAKLRKSLYVLYNELHILREKYAKEFSKNVLAELQNLGMGKANFTVEFDYPKDENLCAYDSINGFDTVEFMFSANLGEPLKPLSFVISGGEMSRFMLAIKAQTAKYNEISTFIFDEIDSGISGNIAKVVAEKFALISKDVQVIAITHLPQISAMADNNLLIEKTDDGICTKTAVHKLDENAKINEIIRLVGGEKDSESAKMHAKELIEIAKNFKKTI